MGLQVFVYRIVWAKLRRGLKDTPLFFSERDFHFGLGLTTRHNTEICLLARRGNCRRIAKNVRELTITPVREHSRKPAEAYSFRIRTPLRNSWARARTVHVFRKRLPICRDLGRGRSQ